MQYEERDDEHEDEVRPHLVPTSSLSKSGCAIHRGRMTMRTTSLRCRPARTQVGWQLASLRRRFGRAAIACLLLLLALRPALADHDQCARACRVANGHTGAPAVLGHTGDWFDATVSGRRLLSSPHECECYAVAGGAAVPHPRVPRLHAPLETAEQWHFRTRRVWGADSKEYRSAAWARRAGVRSALHSLYVWPRTSCRSCRRSYSKWVLYDGVSEACLCGLQKSRARYIRGVMSTL